MMSRASGSRSCHGVVAQPVVNGACCYPSDILLDGVPVIIVFCTPLGALDHP